MSNQPVYRDILELLTDNTVPCVTLHDPFKIRGNYGGYVFKADLFLTKF